MATLNNQNWISYQPKVLGLPPLADALALVEAARHGRLVLYLGAGVSISAPSYGPSGNDVADRLLPIVGEILDETPQHLIGLDLESLAAEVESKASDHLNHLKVRAADTCDFRNMEPNYAHEMIALLMREGLIRVVSANWDCAVEAGGLRIGVAIEGASRASDVLNLAINSLPVYKVHGCARRPATLVLTRDEVDEPQLWARAEVAQALAGGVVAFIGLGTVGSYVSEPVEQLLELWDDGTASVRVVDPGGPSEVWETVLGTRSAEVAVPLGANEFLDELVRAATGEALSRATQTADELHQHEQVSWSATTVSGIRALRDAMRETPADAILRWWRDGVSTSENGKPFIFEPAGQVSLICVAQLAALDTGPPSARGEEGTLTVRSSSRYFEIACRPQAHWEEVARIAYARISRRRRGGRYTPGTPVTVVIHGASGRFPDPSAPLDIAAGSPQDSDVAAASRDDIIAVRAEHALEGRLVPQ